MNCHQNLIWTSTKSNELSHCETESRAYVMITCTWTAFSAWPLSIWPVPLQKGILTFWAPGWPWEVALDVLMTACSCEGWGWGSEQRILVRSQLYAQPGWWQVEQGWKQVILCHQCPKLPHALSGVVLCFDNFLHQGPLLSSLFSVDEGLGSHLVVLSALFPFVGLLMPIVGNKQF